MVCLGLIGMFCKVGTAHGTVPEDLPRYRKSSVRDVKEWRKSSVRDAKEYGESSVRDAKEWWGSFVRGVGVWLKMIGWDRSLFGYE